MQIPFAVYTFAVKGGVIARAPQVGVSGFGHSEPEAEQSLAEVLRAWCSSLARAGKLEEALRKAGILAKYNGQPLGVELYRESPPGPDFKADSPKLTR